MKPDEVLESECTHPPDRAKGPGRPSKGERVAQPLVVRSAELLEIHLPMKSPFSSRSGTRRQRRIVLVRLEGDDAVGWGECVAPEEPGYTDETVETAWHALSRFVLPPLPGRRIEVPGEVLEPSAWVRGHRMAKAAAEMAVRDLEAKVAGEPLARRLGGESTGVAVGVVVGLMDDADRLLDVVERHLERGYARVKLKIAPGWDLEPLRRVRDRFGDELALAADANAAYTLDDLERLRELDDLGLTMIEQPLAFDDFLDHARLQETLRTPVCLDESLRSPRDVRLALHIGSCRVVNLKPGRVGGLGEALDVHDYCRARDVVLWCGGMLETGIGRAHNLALATLPGFTAPGDISESARYWEQDIVDPQFVLKDGRLHVSEAPGIGVEPDVERIRALTVRRTLFG